MTTHGFCNGWWWGQKRHGRLEGSLHLDGGEETAHRLAPQPDANADVFETAVARYDEQDGRKAATLAGRRDGWDLRRFLSGIEAEEDAPAPVIAQALTDARPPEFADDFTWCKHLATDSDKLRKLVGGCRIL